jgi:membrane-associated protease RseP (regulator of RpoE activity)
MSMSIEDFAKLAAALVQVESRKPNDFLSATAIEKLPELRPGSGGEGEIFFGGDGHYTAAFALWPSKGLGIVVESNSGDSDDLCSALVKTVRSTVAPDIESSEPAQPSGAPRGRYGLQIQAEAEDDSLTVKAVEPESPAAKAGLKEGDRIIAINDTPIEKLSPDERMTAFKKSPLSLRIEREGKPLTMTLHLP